jgi:hypothetical protein
MTSAVTITPDFKEVRQFVENLINDPKARTRLLRLASLELSDRMRVYPPEGLYNHEPGAQGNGVWYQRQFGSRYRRKNGTLGGRNTSQKLQKNWRVERVDAFSTSVYTEVTYAPYLFDPNQRASWAASHGWKDLNEVEADYAPRFVELALEMVDEQASKPIR